MVKSRNGHALDRNVQMQHREDYNMGAIKYFKNKVH